MPKPANRRQPILARVDWKTANRVTRHQVRNRELYCPPISLFRWWARRPHSLVSALLDASHLAPRDLVSDPFSGGGTVTLEAIVKGLRVYAQDVNPWPVWGLRTALDGVCPNELKHAVQQFGHQLQQIAARDYTSPCVRHGSSQLLNVFWVRRCKCRRCRRHFYLFPYSLITLASRNTNESCGYFGCHKCGRVTIGRVNRPGLRCACGELFAPARLPLFGNKRIICPHCDLDLTGVWHRRRQWKPVLLQRLCAVGKSKIVHFDECVNRTDSGPRRHSVVPAALNAYIRPGRETNVLRRAGFRAWSNLYPPRQMKALLSAADAAFHLNVPTPIRNRILLAVAGTAEMAGFLCRWDRFHPKTFEALANHRFSPVGIAVESNPVATQGRGTIRRRLAASIKAAQWLHKANERSEPGISTVVCGNSAKQRLSNRSAALVLTDPPYFDAVQYGELAELFLAWSRAVTCRSRGWTFESRSEAVPNPSRGNTIAHHQRILRRIFQEVARTLKPAGTLLLTYHSTNFCGWAALGNALSHAGFQIVALATGHSENEKDHPKRGHLNFTTDLVLECRKNGSHANDSTLPLIVTRPRTSEQRELIAAGIIIARRGNEDYPALASAFRQQTRRLRNSRIHVPRLA